jgi:hypothetical protein
MNKETDIAWLAGFMEGEGSFFIAHQRRSNRDKDMLRPGVDVTNTDPALISKAHTIFDNMGVKMHVRQYSNKKGSTRPVFQLGTARQDYVKIVCDTLYPYLFGEKKARVELVLNFVNSRLEKRKEGCSPEYTERDWEQFDSFRNHVDTVPQRLHAKTATAV